MSLGVFLCLPTPPRCQGAPPEHVRVHSSCRCFPRDLVSFDPQRVTRDVFFQSEKAFELGDITQHIIYIFFPVCNPESKKLRRSHINRICLEPGLQSSHKICRFPS